MHVDKKYLTELINRIPDKPPLDSITEFIVENRVMPPGTPFPGVIDITRTPFTVEWMENMSPASTVQHQIIMKAAQIAATWTVENIIGYYMKIQPTAIMYVSATQDLLEKWGTKRLEPMIDSMGIREIIMEATEQTWSKRSRRTGDKTFSKQFIGGFLEMASSQSPASLRSDSIRLLIIDETDGAPANLRSGEGNFIKVAENRTKSYGHRKKITALSTPTTVQASLIAPMHKEGDKREFMMPCPLCGESASFYWLPDEGSYGLRADTKAGEIKKVYYLCYHCRDAIFETEKHGMMNAGEWEPTAEKASNVKRSYSINTLYAPPGAVNWMDYYKEFEKSKDDPELFKAFTNLYGGQPYREQGQRPKPEAIINLRGGYAMGTVPKGVLFLTIGADVQEGKEELRKLTNKQVEDYLRDGGRPEDLPRIELEVLGHGAGYRTWSIEYKVFYGSVTNPFIGAWENCYQWQKDTGLRYQRADGRVFIPTVQFYDSGDGNIVDAVYGFTGREFLTPCFPCKGSKPMNLKDDPHADKTDEMSNRNFDRYRYKITGSQRLYLITTNYYKKKIYNSLNNVKRSPGRVNPPGYYDFPREYGLKGTYLEDYFKGLSAEEQLSNGSFYQSRRRNEPLDCKVYALCGGDVYLETQVKTLRAAAQKSGMTPKQSESVINVVYVLKKLIKDSENQGYYVDG